NHLAPPPAHHRRTSPPPAPSPIADSAPLLAHETAVHRIDADAAAGTEGLATAPELALDGFDELLRGFLSRGRSTLRSERPRTVLVSTTDGPGRWLATVSEEPLSVELTEAPADLTLTGPARDLYLLLWNRLPAGTGRVEHSGDETLLALWRETATIG
ncbi:hypothetical protein ACFC0A_35840, partial [Kitasatospora purpeofusca]